MVGFKVFCVFSASVFVTLGLECGINLNGSEEQFRELTNLCTAGNKSVVTDKPRTSSEEDDDYEENENIAPKVVQSLGDESINATTITPNSENQTGVAQQCVVQCVFERLELTDSSGYPEHHKILAALLKNAEGRELKDFLQDSTDECFKFMKQAETLDSCTYSALLVTCLADKGRANCGDWPVGNLPFQQG